MIVLNVLAIYSLLHFSRQNFQVALITYIFWISETTTKIEEEEDLEFYDLSALYRLFK